MYFNVENLSDKELRKLELLFGKRLSVYRNPYYQICVEEIISVLENEMDEKEYLEFTKDPLFLTYVSEMAQNLYEIVDYQWDEIYEKALYVFNENM
jgi:hypothetical protein